MILWLATATGLGAISALIAYVKGRSPLGWGACGTVLGVVVVPYLACSEPVRTAGRDRPNRFGLPSQGSFCRECGARVEADAAVCRVCRHPSGGAAAGQAARRREEKAVEPEAPRRAEAPGARIFADMTIEEASKDPLFDSLDQAFSRLTEKPAKEAPPTEEARASIRFPWASGESWLETSRPVRERQGPDHAEEAAFTAGGTSEPGWRAAWVNPEDRLQPSRPAARGWGGRPLAERVVSTLREADLFGFRRAFRYIALGTFSAVAVFLALNLAPSVSSDSPPVVERQTASRAERNAAPGALEPPAIDLNTAGDPAADEKAAAGSPPSTPPASTANPGAGMETDSGRMGGEATETVPERAQTGPIAFEPAPSLQSTKEAEKRATPGRTPAAAKSLDVETVPGNVSARGQIVALVQQRLRERGYDPGSVDGLAGPKTRNAIAKLQRRLNRKADGEIDARLLEALGITGKQIFAFKENGVPLKN